MTKIGFIGAGNMATALMNGILDKAIYNHDDIIVSDKDQPKLAAAKDELKVFTTQNNIEVVEKSDIVFLAVKPQVISAVLEEIKDSISDDKMIISIAAGIKIGNIESIIGNKKIIRVMPNTPCLVGEMAAGFSPNAQLSDQDIDKAREILESSGKAFQLDEDLIDAVTGLSGSGPAFVARLIEAFTEAGKENNLPEDVAYALALKTFEGTAKLLSEKKLKPSELVDLVSSPNGTTVAGREILEDSDMNDIISKTITRATERSKELGEKK